MQLANQVVIVHGAQRSALYDLYARRIQRIPKALACKLEESAAAQVPIAAAAFKPILAYLTHHRFLQPRREGVPRLPFRLAHQWPLRPRTSSVRITLTRTNAQRLRQWLHDPGTAAQIRFLSVSLQDGLSDSFLSELLAPLRRRWNFGWERVQVAAPGDYQSTLLDGDAKVVGFKRATATPRLAKKLSPSVESYSLLQRYSELAGQLVIDADENVLPHPAETAFGYGALAPITQIVQRERFRVSLHNAKSKRARCKDCELRLACVHPFADRVDAQDITSEPKTCPYDPRSPDEQNELFSAQ